MWMTRCTCGDCLTVVSRSASTSPTSATLYGRRAALPVRARTCPSNSRSGWHQVSKTCTRHSVQRARARPEHHQEHMSMQGLPSIQLLGDMSTKASTCHGQSVAVAAQWIVLSDECPCRGPSWMARPRREEPPSTSPTAAWTCCPRCCQSTYAGAVL